VLILDGLIPHHLVEFKTETLRMVYPFLSWAVPQVHSILSVLTERVGIQLGEISTPWLQCTSEFLAPQMVMDLRTNRIRHVPVAHVVVVAPMQLTGEFHLVAFCL